jgi:hypothetical protein
MAYAIHESVVFMKRTEHMQYALLFNSMIGLLSAAPALQYVLGLLLSVHVAVGAPVTSPGEEDIIVSIFPHSDDMAF